MIFFRKKKQVHVSPNNEFSVEKNLILSSVEKMLLHDDDDDVVVKPSRCSNSNSSKMKEEQQKKKKTNKKQVSFSKITIREYPIIIGDYHLSSTSSSGGPPITISWDYTNSIDIDVDLYEDYYWGGDPAVSPSSSRRRRNQSEMKIPKEIRIQILQNSGYTMRQINEAMKMKISSSSNQLQNRRRRRMFQQSNNANIRLDYNMIESCGETFKQRFENVITLGRKNEGKNNGNK